MRMRSVRVCAFVLSCATSLALQTAVAAAATGQAVPMGTVIDAGFTDIRWQPRRLTDFGDKRAFVLFFTSVDCPLVKRYLPGVAALAHDFDGKGVQFLLVDSGGEDTLVAAAAQGVELAPALPCSREFAGTLARACGVDRTATAVVLDQGRHLVYRGRVDAQFNYSGSSPTRGREDLRAALTDLLAGRPVTVPETAVEGCRITWPSPPARRDVTFCRDIAPLLQQHCQDCHRPGGDAPFALLDYHDCKRRAAMLEEVVAQARMPPWYGSEQHGTFSNHRGLTAAERDTVLAWTAAGAPEGQRSELPPPRTFPQEEWRIGKPDLVLKVPVPIRIPADGYLPYRYFVLPCQFAHDTWVEAIEIKPDNKQVLHHCNLARVRPGSLPGQDGFITGQVPGGDAMMLDPGTAVRIPAGSVLALQAHYVTTGRPEVDHLRVGLRFPRQRVQKELHVQIVANYHFAIPPGAAAWPVQAVRTMPTDALGIGLFVHMHLRGRDMTVTAEAPDGTVESLLLVPNYSFDWQQSYRWSKAGKPFAKGTRITALAHFDNSAFNPFNPDPQRTVRFGLSTRDEMMYAFLFYVDAHEHLDLRVDEHTGWAAGAGR
jgi:hypothetical protein